MGYNRNLKNRRNPVIKYIKEKLIELDKENISDEEIFEICDTILKVVELHFKIQNYIIDEKQAFAKFNTHFYKNPEQTQNRKKFHHFAITIIEF